MSQRSTSTWVSNTAMYRHTLMDLVADTIGETHNRFIAGYTSDVSYSRLHSPFIWQ